MWKILSSTVFDLKHKNFVNRFQINVEIYEQLLLFSDSISTKKIEINCRAAFQIKIEVSMDALASSSSDT